MNRKGVKTLSNYYKFFYKAFGDSYCALELAHTPKLWPRTKCIFSYITITKNTPEVKNILLQGYLCHEVGATPEVAAGGMESGGRGEYRGNENRDGSEDGDSGRDGDDGDGATGTVPLTEGGRVDAGALQGGTAG